MKKILLATDGSSCADNAAWFLAHLPHDEKLELIILSVIEGPYIHRSYPLVPWTDEDIDRERAQAEESFIRIEPMFGGANISVRHLALDGHRSETIVQAASDEQVDLVVLGAKGHSAVARMLIGSTSDYVATHAPCSVLVVRPTGMREELRPIRIAIAYEDTPPAQGAIDEIGEINWGPEPDVRVIAVDNMPGIFSPMVKESLAVAADRAAEQLRTAAPNARAHLLESAHIGDALVEYAEDHDIDLLVVGETPRTRIDRVILGSVSRFVLRHAPCSVWITRQRGIENTEKPVTKG